MQSDDVLHGRTWLWLRLQIEELLTVPPQVVVDQWGRVHHVPQTRLALSLAPPDFTPPATPPSVAYAQE